MNTVYIGLGSNLSDPEQQIKQALHAISAMPDSELVKTSSLYFSRPMGPQDQPDYMNAVAKLHTQLTPLSVLDHLQAIENKAGRIRKENRWGARVLDLDILLYDQELIENERLTVPHYGLKAREFVLIPLAEICDDLVLPDGDKIQTLASNIPANGLKIHSQLSYPLQMR
ncbi:2-amino-4-hydroxy-6-hydroxymethyldihydropteridine diphosphokinase [Thalassotalea sp. G2M2-11]|uniref:2-amino-4-hydroxy-6- hydroxymethyldihydropteridine diphosphokinase n=1 Tax=Thalassotalea sp. G2M2-11 TaxID=2787627 RepID=UPI0019CF4E9C|nr:2-amino-4-hydroxy-6-hydroxymethyldihydropteridine diphosphokinase [Thalassotalea sp. G2M2-11]